MSPDSEVILSSHSTKTRLVSLTLSAVGIAAILTGGIIGWVGVPRSEAAAATTTARTLPARDSAGNVRFAKVVSAALPDSAQQRLAPKVKRPTIRKRNVATAYAIGKGPWKKARVSWYGPGFYGNGMAGGGKLKRNSMVVAHRSMKFGTKILFKYKGRTVIATVKDRGPFIAGRTFDLGPGTAKALHFQGVGTVSYRIIK